MKKHLLTAPAEFGKAIYRNIPWVLFRGISIPKVRRIELQIRNHIPAHMSLSVSSGGQCIKATSSLETVRQLCLE